MGGRGEECDADFPEGLQVERFGGYGKDVIVNIVGLVIQRGEVCPSRAQWVHQERESSQVQRGRVRWMRGKKRKPTE